MSRRLTRAEKKAQTRRVLLDSAATLFARRGYEATTVDAIAERVGLTRGAVYANFAGKEEMLFAVTERASRVIADSPVFADRSVPFPDRIRAYAHQLVEDWKRVEQAVLLYSELELLAARRPKVRARFAPVMAASLAAQGAALDTAAVEEDVLLPVDGQRALMLAGAAVRGLIRERIVHPTLVDERLIGDAFLLVCGYDPQAHPVPVTPTTPARARAPRPPSPPRGRAPARAAPA